MDHWKPMSRSSGSRGLRLHETVIALTSEELRPIMVIGAIVTNTSIVHTPLCFTHRNDERMHLPVMPHTGCPLDFLPANDQPRSERLG
ncbi:hypothetical protein K239x_11890 [Planctomycetes bacterium K23_9]|uniref:Uncharacterized protein n=1 Tax=Stieleria marina TaxID=1930275 RepID=A0A517NQ42_9BACT|nr:hypothetical protein K239x_11890 [Planctomycetes bacterium K23_9]